MSEPPASAATSRVRRCCACGTISRLDETHRCASGGYLMAWVLVAVVVFGLVWVGVR